MLISSEIDIKIVKKRKSFKLLDILKQQAEVFFLSTSLHGYKYIMQFGRPKFDRYVWVVIISSLLCCSLVAMIKAWSYNSAHSTLSVIESTHHGVWNFPFPAVTICNVNQVSYKKARKLINKLKFLRGLTPEYVLKEMRLLTEMLDHGIFGYDVYINLTILQDIFDANNYTTDHVMKMVKQDCSILIRNCMWRGDFVPCNSIFEETSVRDGHCCSFNYFHKRSIINSKREPQKINSCGFQTALRFETYPEPEDYYATLYPSYGVKAMLHYPYNYPDHSAHFKLIGLEVQNFFSIDPVESHSTSAMRSLPLKDRQCIFNDDKNALSESLQLLMDNFTMLKYTYINCLNNCRTTVIVTECGCAPFYIPQSVFRVCNLRDLACLKKIRHIYDSSWPGLEISSTDLSNINIDILNRPCGCFPDCTIYMYPFDSSQGTLNTKTLLYSLNKKVNELRNFSIINVFFTDLVATKYRNDAYFTWITLLASFGGLLGLFIGFSATSIFEMIYFFVMPLIFDNMKNKMLVKQKNEY